MLSEGSTNIAAGSDQGISDVGLGLAIGLPLALLVPSCLGICVWGWLRSRHSRSKALFRRVSVRQARDRAGNKPEMERRQSSAAVVLFDEKTGRATAVPRVASSPGGVSVDHVSVNDVGSELDRQEAPDKQLATPDLVEKPLTLGGVDPASKGRSPPLPATAPSPAAAQQKSLLLPKSSSSKWKRPPSPFAEAAASSQTWAEEAKAAAAFAQAAKAQAAAAEAEVAAAERARLQATEVAQKEADEAALARRAAQAAERLAAEAAFKTRLKARVEADKAAEAHPMQGRWDQSSGLPSSWDPSACSARPSTEGTAKALQRARSSRQSDASSDYGGYGGSTSSGRRRKPGSRRRIVKPLDAAATAAAAGATQEQTQLLRSMSQRLEKMEQQLQALTDDEEEGGAMRKSASKPLPAAAPDATQQSPSKPPAAASDASHTTPKRRRSSQRPRAATPGSAGSVCSVSSTGSDLAI